MAKSWFIEFVNAPPHVAERRLRRQGEKITLGRIRGADVVVDWDRKISRMHAKLEFIDNAIHITDLNSTNGTYLMDKVKTEKIKGTKAAPSPVTVKFGDTVATVSFGEFLSEDSTIVTQSLLLSSVEEIRHKRLFESILVLDQCGSSTLADLEGDATAFHLKKRMFQLCDSVFKEYAPSFTKNTGDGFFATFKEAGTCFSAARTVMKRIRLRNKVTQHLPIEVRIGLHAGETYYMDLTNMDRHGNDVNAAFRIEGVAADAFPGGARVPLPEKDRIIVSRPFLDLIPAEKENFLLLGRADLKGIKESMELYLFNESSSVS